jgi:hypothetical protein
VLAATAYTDYYYLIPEGVLAMVIVTRAIGDWSVMFQGRGSAAHRATRIVAALTHSAIVIAVIALLAAWRSTSHHHFDPLASSIREISAARRAVVASAANPVVRAARPTSLVPIILIMTATMVAEGLPVISHAVSLITSGGYVTQKYCGETRQGESIWPR